jgi:hypothetical protein
MRFCVDPELRKNADSLVVREGRHTHVGDTDTLSFAVDLTSQRTPAGFRFSLDRAR